MRSKISAGKSESGTASNQSDWVEERVDEKEAEDGNGRKDQRSEGEKVSEW